MVSSGWELEKWSTENYNDLYHLFEISLHQSLQNKLTQFKEREREKNLELVEIENSKTLVMFSSEALILLYQKIIPIDFSQHRLQVDTIEHSSPK